MNDPLNPLEVIAYGFAWGMAVALFAVPICTVFYLERFFNKRMAHRFDEAKAKSEAARRKMQEGPQTPPPPKPKR